MVSPLAVSAASKVTETPFQQTDATDVVTAKQPFSHRPLFAWIYLCSVSTLVEYHNRGTHFFAYFTHFLALRATILTTFVNSSVADINVCVADKIANIMDENVSVGDENCSGEAEGTRTGVSMLCEEANFIT